MSKNKLLGHISLIKKVISTKYLNFQLKIDLSELEGVEISEIEFQNGVGGRAEEHGWTIGVNDSGFVIGFAQESGDPIPAGEGVLTSFIVDGIELGSSNGQITISDLYASGYFGSELSTEIGPSILINPSLEFHSFDYLPNDTELYPAYPNPFNPITTLRYELPEDSFVDITVYDMLGNVVNNLVNANELSGYKSIQWDATNNQGEPVSAGVYLYKIQAGDFVDTKKMILLK